MYPNIFIVVIVGIARKIENNNIMFSGKCTSAARLDGKTAIVTGSNTGIGKVTAKEFYRIGTYE